MLILHHRPFCKWTDLTPKIQFLLRKIFPPFVSLDRCPSCHFRQPPLRTISTHQIFSCNVKIGALVRAGKIEAARRLFDEMPERDVVSWNAIIAAYWQNGNFEEAKRMFDLMPARNVISWNSMVAGCIENESIDKACEYFREMPDRNVASWNAMISGFIRYNRIEEAARLFEEMPQQNVISYTAMVDGYAQKGEIERARALFDRIPRKNAVSWTVMISGYVENGMFDEARRLFDQMPKKNVVTLTAMITGYCKEGKMENARNLFEEIRHRDLVSWNAIIAGYAHNGHGEDALKLHSQMLKTGTKPDHSTLIVVLTACSLLVSLRHGRQTHTIVVKCGFESNISVCNTLITMYSKSGSIDESYLAFRQIFSPDVVSWNTIIAGYAQHGHYEKALCLFDEMCTNGFKPDGITFLNVLSACGHVGKVKESMDWFDSMVNGYRIEPRAEHYSCLVDILSRAGQLEKAYEVIKEMPFEADGSVWGALLGACRVHLNVELGELAATKLVSLEPQNSAAYVMLSNIYAAAGMWKKVTRVRGLMKEQGVKKQPGYSWMEIEEKVHLFLGGDISHPEIDKIHSELDRIGLQMKMVDDLIDVELLNTV
ncbi:pentatricopeptide repeat-containing protein At4g02750-like [Magnolia sinica]|uniref:pentatricopeptide repeat-containing protein At4g02750-like n=1 Tax=Magnolia sinica TaxID=86752 RepID=UPI00265A3BDD|nr:pentatricopeptide repeat-containing protein At4g02750-like [Magnolia sinica]